MESVTSWLTDHGLARYAACFIAADIDVDILTELTDADLEKLGVSFGDRKRLLRAVSAPRVLTSAAVDVPEAVPPPVADHGERRQLTVLFCDIVGSTELAGRLDPEDLRTAISLYHTRCSEIVKRHGGEIAQFLGDGVMAQFGFPRAHEDDAQRAARCALDLVAAVRNLELADRLRLQTRIGIATGTEVIGDLPGATRDRMSVIGSTPNLAARLQSVAEPETVVVAAATRRLLGDMFTLAALPSRSIKGFGENVALWRVDGENRGLSRFALRHPATTTTRFVGREFELGLLFDRLRLANASDSQVVLLVAEAGVGKSRIVEEFIARTQGDGNATIRLQCSPHYAATALQPIRDFIESSRLIVASDTTSERFAKLRSFDARAPRPSEERVSAYALLLGLEGADQAEIVAAMTTEQRKMFIFRALLEAIGSIARAMPLCFVVEDLHWVDPTTLEWLTQLFDAVQDERVLVIATGRPNSSRLGDTSAN